MRGDKGDFVTSQVHTLEEFVFLDFFLALGYERT
jgi:hypothetical protein